MAEWCTEKRGYGREFQSEPWRNNEAGLVGPKRIFRLKWYPFFIPSSRAGPYPNLNPQPNPIPNPDSSPKPTRILFLSLNPDLHPTIILHYTATRSSPDL